LSSLRAIDNCNFKVKPHRPTTIANGAGRFIINNIHQIMKVKMPFMAKYGDIILSFQVEDFNNFMCFNLSGFLRNKKLLLMISKI